MKRKLVFVTLAVPFLAAPMLMGCQGSVDETPDGYVDVLPTETKDGTILQAFCWKYNDVKSQLPYIANAGFKSVQLSPVQVPKSGGSSWWAYYQPLAFRIADNNESALGTKAELKALCDEAEKYNISIIADIVFNHMANIDDEHLEPDETPMVSPIVEDYEEYIYQHRNDTTDPTFHHNPNAEGSGADTQVYQYGKLPDLNTAHPYVQERALALLKECIDVGIDGFRFDAAKHIETPDDPEYASNFWPNTLGVAKEYYKTKTGHELFAYGETLGSPANRDIDVYTKLMYVFDGGYCNQVYTAVSNRKAEKAVSAKFRQDTDATNLLTCSETHDTFADEIKEGTSPWSNEFISRSWAVINSRKDTRSFFLARPDAPSLAVGNIGDYFFRNEVIGAVNRFKNRFVGASEEQGSDGAIYFNERFNDDAKGAVVVDFKMSKEIDVKFNHLGTAVYYDQITGKAVTVRNGKATIELDQSGISVLTMSKNEARPSFDIDARGGLFAGEKDVKVEYKNATTATYQINDGAEMAFNSGDHIKIKASDAKDGYVNLKITVSNSQFSETETFVFKPFTKVEGYFNVVGLRSNYFDEKIYMWIWDGKGNDYWSNEYEVRDGLLLINDSVLTGKEGFKVVVFDRTHVIPDIHKWSPEDDAATISQSTDIKGNILTQGYFDGSGM